MNATTDSDFELLEAWKGGDPAAGKLLLDRYFPRLRRYFIQRVDDAHEDLVQETFARVVEGRDRFEGRAPFSVYLFSIARNVLSGHLRQRYKLGGEFDPLTSDSSIADITGRRQSSLLAEREELRILLDALRALPLAQQELLEHYYWQRMTGREIAELLGIKESTLRGRLRLALGKLAERFSEIANHPHTRELEPELLEGWFDALRPSSDET